MTASIDEFASNQDRGNVDDDKKPFDDIEKEVPSQRLSNVWKGVSPLYNQLERIKQEESSDRRASLFCMSCCDIVKGCIVVNIIQICFVTLYFVIRLLDNPLFSLQWEEDEEQSAIQEFLDPRGVVGITWTAFMLANGFMAIVGAWKFHKNTILLAAILNCIDVILKVLIMQWTNFLGSCLCCYAQMHLFVELKSRRMARENYRNEKQCCCYRC